MTTSADASGDASADRRARMRRRLRVLYGADAGDRAFADLARLLDRVGPLLPPSASAAELPFDQSDVLLITYGDTFLAPGEPPLRALAAFAERHLRELVSTIHVLPFFPYSSDYGFAVKDYLQVNPELGTWDDVAALHRLFELMVDFVLNHVSAEGPWFEAFLRQEPPYDRFFITLDPDADLRGVTRPRTTPLLTPVETAAGPRSVWTTFGPDQVDLNYAEPVVLLRMIEVLLSYVERGADLVRMDAVGYLWKRLGTPCIHLPEAHEVVKLYRDVLDEAAPGVAIVTETNVPHRDNIAYFGNGRDEARMVYQFPLAPLVLHALATGDARTLGAWVATLETPSAQTTFFNFLASHDGVGVVPATGILSPDDIRSLADRVLAHGGEVSYKANPDGSESPYELNATWFDALSDPNDAIEPWQTKLDRFTCSQAIMLALAGVPGVYVHSLLGSHNDRAAYARSSWKRDLNHERLDLATVEARLADPSSETAQVFGRYAALLRARRAQPAFHPNAPQRVVELHRAVLALVRGPFRGQAILALHNMSAASVTLDLARGASLPELAGASLRELLHTGGDTSSGRVTLAPYGVVWLAAEVG